MNNNPLHIAILEPSIIISEGITNILLKLGPKYALYHVESIEELCSSTHKDWYNVIIINPLLVQGNQKVFNSARKLLNKATWVGLVYSYFDKEILSLFDEHIQINDSKDIIKGTIERVYNHSGESINIPQKEQLSDREIDVLKLLVNGLSNKEIADKLNISIHTVISHRKNIGQKTSIKSQAGLTIFAISNKIISIDSFSE